MCCISLPFVVLQNWFDMVKNCVCFAINCSMGNKTISHKQTIIHSCLGGLQLFLLFGWIAGSIAVVFVVRSGCGGGVDCSCFSCSGRLGGRVAGSIAVVLIVRVGWGVELRGRLQLF